MKEIITLSRHETQRMQVLEQVVRKSLSLKVGATLMKVCYRQAKRLAARYRKEGPKGLAHRRRIFLLGLPEKNCYPNVHSCARRFGLS
jgi:hypothetical protein